MAVAVAGLHRLNQRLAGDDAEKAAAAIDDCQRDIPFRQLGLLPHEVLGLAITVPNNV